MDSGSCDQKKTPAIIAISIITAEMIKAVLEDTIGHLYWNFDFSEAYYSLLILHLL